MVLGGGISEDICLALKPAAKKLKKWLAGGGQLLTICMAL
jgi:hypothetical protein